MVSCWELFMTMTLAPLKIGLDSVPVRILTPSLTVTSNGLVLLMLLVEATLPSIKVPSKVKL